MKQLFDYLQKDRVSHAILISGGEESTRSELSMEVAKALLCVQRRGRGCGKCRFCQRVEKNILPDFVYLAGEEEHIKIDEIRDLTHRMEISPLEARSKVAVIARCERMNAAAANALLKSLEEPLEDRYFVLTTGNPNDLLPTVLSRCVEFHLKPGTEVLEVPSVEVIGALERGAVSELLMLLRDKEGVLSLVRFLLQEFRNNLFGRPAVFAAGRSRYWYLDQFDSVLELERRLRSQANYGLLLEVYLRDKLFGSHP